ncbi:hypothetical protein GCM10010911_07330 [Paenibacillus nasutitermitis]|uniref:Uncharacterized protein n=1 Tax=Paenibacillus nasutitermitis TaxID=1652958 RepID=A0A916YMR8_9BACL|nr:hypothetical protein GCM10010911_07330 [Paenibacillus nasutitermitis]
MEGDSNSHAQSKISTFINELINTGFVIDKVIEDSKVDDNDTSNSSKWYSGTKARIIPSRYSVLVANGVHAGGNLTKHPDAGLARLPNNQTDSCT